MMRRAAAVAALLLSMAVTGWALSPCDVSVSSQSLASNNFYSILCPSSVRSTISYVVTGDQQYDVLFTDGADCTSSTPQYYSAYSVLTVAAGTTTSKLVPSGFTGTWDAPCVRVRNRGGSAMAALSIQVQFYPPTYENQFHLNNTAGLYLGVPGNDVNVVR
jgi:hypothetical protein